MGNDAADNELPLCLVFYGPMIAILLMIIALIMKLVWNWNEEDRNVEVRVSETSGLLSHKEEEASFISYGTHEEDLESSGGRSCSSTSEDLYDGKICVICYDDQRSCFFTPCGHCITCYTCAKRIASQEIKTCPICRTIIKEVTRLHIL